jgi:ribosomal protein S18 acetylase RimI-like enzyme
MLARSLDMDSKRAVPFRLRPAGEHDRAFLYTLHCQTMRGMIEQTWGWDEVWQRQDFNRRFREYTASIIERAGRAAGALLLESKPDSIYIHEVQVSPGHQGRGIGGAVVQWVIEQAANRGVSVTLSVLEVNPRARQLYERLGFQVTAFDAPFFRMRHDAR